jgi:hypothetical protein
MNPKSIETVSSTNLQVVGLAPAQASAALYQSMANSAGLAAMNAVMAQQQSNIIHQTATSLGVSMIYSLGGLKTGGRKKR